MGNQPTEKSDKNLEALRKNRRLNFVDRIVNANQYPTRPNPDGSSSTHLMAWGTADGKNVAFPTLVYDKNSKSLIEPENPFAYAMEHKEYIPFDDPSQAEDFAAGGYKEGFNMNAVKALKPYRNYVTKRK